MNVLLDCTLSQVFKTAFQKVSLLALLGGEKYSVGSILSIYGHWF
jgi:hypothetical protein